MRRWKRHSIFRHHTVRRTTSSDPPVPAVAVDVEFLKYGGRTLCRSVGVVPFVLRGGTSTFPEDTTGAGRATVVHLAPATVMHHADVLPAGFAFAATMRSPQAKKCFGRSLNPYGLLNPLKHRRLVRQAVEAALGHGTASEVRDAIRLVLKPWAVKEREQESVDALCAALTRRDTAVRAARLLDDLGDQAFAAATAQVESRAFREPGDVVNVSSLVDLTRTLQLLFEMLKRTRLDAPLRFVAYGSGDEGPLNDTISLATERHDAKCVLVHDITTDPSFKRAMSRLGLRPLPKLVEVAGALAEHSKEVDDFLRSTGGVQSNHNALWDAQCLAFVARYTFNGE
jgi:hypothetical protein